MLTVSNIAWRDGADSAFLLMVANAGFDGIDVAPTKVWPEWQIPEDLGESFRFKLESYGLSAVGMQSLFFGAGPLNLFAQDIQDVQAFMSHMKRLAAIAKTTGVSRVVFGAPANRDPGNLEKDIAWQLAGDRLCAIGDYYESCGIQLCMEPVPAALGGKFLRSTEETVAFLNTINHKAVRLNLDTAVLFSEAADITRTIAECAELIGHVHASEPGLGSFGEPQVDHATVSDALRSIGYSGAVAIEMAARPSFESSNLSRALDYVGSIYA